MTTGREIHWSRPLLDTHTEGRTRPSTLPGPLMMTDGEIHWSRPLLDTHTHTDGPDLVLYQDH